ncbi:hypothetical protein BDR06DRAFT_476547 [Suillus hirtellus]|nr:hypothetical protein BDR06DRAFT_476547 [Suillus hirtellus]
MRGNVPGRVSVFAPHVLPVDGLNRYGGDKPGLPHSCRERFSPLIFGHPWSQLSLSRLLRQCNLNVPRKTQSRYCRFPPLSSRLGELIRTIQRALRSALSVWRFVPEYTDTMSVQSTLFHGLRSEKSKSDRKFSLCSCAENWRLRDWRPLH